MVAPRWVARANRAGLNKVVRRVADRVPGFGLVTHVGRKSGRSYRTPVNVFRVDGGYAVALTYGPESDWVRNVLAAGGCELTTHRGPVTLTAPELRHDPKPSPIPGPLRPILAATGTHDYLYLTTAS